MINSFPFSSTKRPTYPTQNFYVFLVRYVEKGHTCTYLLDLVELSEAKAENLYTCFLNSLRKNNLPLTNIVGACVDKRKRHGGSI